MYELYSIVKVQMEPYHGVNQILLTPTSFYEKSYEYKNSTFRVIMYNVVNQDDALEYSYSQVGQ